MNGTSGDTVHLPDKPPPEAGSNLVRLKGRSLLPPSGAESADATNGCKMYEYRRPVAVVHANDSPRYFQHSLSSYDNV